MKNPIRLVLATATLAAAALSNAIIFSFSGQTVSGATAPVGVFGTFPPAGAIASQSPFNTISSGLVTLTGGAGSTVVFTNAASVPAGTASTVTITFTGTQDDGSLSGGLSSLSSIGTITAATGVFAAYVSPTNQLTVTSNTYVNSGINFFTVLGNVNAVPEPTSMAALAIGGLGLVARRRRRA